ncbi:lys-conopressin preprohormone isoform X1 [Aplysia californica]|uniref:Lys-conopressin preprohormone isoform X1 n=1 Tax=Aplysia californica TaxID=6500 RepID=A0ABM1A2Z4_APLCA|nr:lys-conopressin preprohormone isoform X1 [Aplysia californica]XP_012939784.1 lys-conopressin preprohormone isoform X1 [Aplysia californica]
MSHSSMSPLSVRTFVLVAGLAVISFSVVADACFIRNCPKGGKRSMDMQLLGQRQCMACGPDGIGQCVGPNICCSPHFGCHIGTPETEICQKENQSTSPCSVRGETCGYRDSGNCVANGICCDSESCAANDRCRLRKETSRIGFDDTQSSRAEVLKLIQKLLRAKEED